MWFTKYSHSASHLLFIIPLWCHGHFTDQKTEAEKDEVVQLQITRAWRSPKPALLLFPAQPPEQEVSPTGCVLKVLKLLRTPRGVNPRETHLGGITGELILGSSNQGRSIWLFRFQSDSSFYQNAGSGDRTLYKIKWTVWFWSGQPGNHQQRRVGCTDPGRRWPALPLLLSRWGVPYCDSQRKWRMINPAAASCFYNSEIYFFQRVKCFIFKPVENTPNLFLVSISLKARCTRLSFKVSACVCVRSCVCVCVCACLKFSLCRQGWLILSVFQQ